MPCPEVREERWLRRNIVALPTMQGAMATVLIAMYILAWEEERKSSSRRPPNAEREAGDGRAFEIAGVEEVS